MFQGYKFWANQNVVKIPPKNDREMKKDKFTKIKQKVIK